MKLFSVLIHRARFNDINLLENLCRDLIDVSNFKVNDSLTLSKTHSDFKGGINSTFRSWKTESGVPMPHELDSFTEITTFIEQQSKIFWDELGYDSNRNLKIFQSWINVSTRSGYMDPHFHAKIPMSAVFYLNASPAQGNLVFQNPLELLLSTQPYKDHQSVIEQEIQVESGDLVIFPGYLKHQVKSNTTDINRISLAANINGE